MKALKNLFLVLMSLLLLISVVAFQEAKVLNKTLLTPETYKKVLSDDKFNQILIDMVKKQNQNENAADMQKANTQGQINTSEKADQAIETEAVELLKKVLNKQIIESKGYPLIDGLFAYLKGDTQTLPVIDLKDLNSIMIEQAIDDEIKKNPVGAMLNREQLKAEAEKDLTLPNQLDLNEYIRENPGNQNTLETAKDLFGIIKRIPLLILALIILISIAIIAATIAPATSLRWLGGTFLLGGLLGLLTYLASTVNLVTAEITDATEKTLATLVLAPLQNYQLQWALIFLILGLVFLVIGFIPQVKLKSKIFTEKIQNAPHAKAIKNARVAVTVIMLLLIPLHVYFMSSPLLKAVDNINTDTQQTSPK